MMHIFLMTLEDRCFKSVGPLRTVRHFEAGHPVMYKGKTAVILGTGSTRSESKRNGSNYYNQAARLHEDEEADFQTQRLEADGHVNQNDEAEPLAKRPKLE